MAKEPNLAPSRRGDPNGKTSQFSSARCRRQPVETSEFCQAASTPAPAAKEKVTPGPNWRTAALKARH